MKKSCWLGCLVLVLAGRASDLAAQETGWRQIARSTNAAPAATLCRPVPMAQGRPYGQPGLLPVAWRTGAADPPAGDDDGSTEPSPFGTDRMVMARTGPAPASASSVVQIAAPIPSTPTASSLPTFAEGGEVAYRTLPAYGAPVPPPDLAGPPGSPCDHCDGPQGQRVWLSAEYLLWWTKSDHLPPLLTTGPATDGAAAGVIGQPNTIVLFGDGGIHGGARSGFRFDAGLWLDDLCHEEALEFGGFLLSHRNTNFQANSAQFGGVLTRPFFNLNAGAEDVERIAFPGLASGSASIASPSNLWGLEANYRCNVCCDCNSRVDAFVGYRYIDLDESLSITENLFGANGGRAAAIDSFRGHTQFNGAQLGLDADCYRTGPWTVNVKGKLGLGDSHETVTIFGDQVVVSTTGVVTHRLGGLYTAGPNPANGTPGNIGRFERDRFSVVPELDLSLSYQLTDNCRIFGGWDFLYWSNVVRPGGQIDRQVDVTNVPNLAAGGVLPTGLNKPGVLFKETDFWASGLHLGVEFRY
jgi:hypothetical protein